MPFQIYRPIGGRIIHKRPSAAVLTVVVSYLDGVAPGRKSDAVRYVGEVRISVVENIEHAVCAADAPDDIGVFDYPRAYRLFRFAIGIGNLDIERECDGSVAYAVDDERIPGDRYRAGNGRRIVRNLD